MDELPAKTRFLREWILFSICVGIGGHVALGLILHAPESWTMVQVSWYGLLITISCYILIQIGQSAWRFWKVDKRKDMNTRGS